MSRVSSRKGSNELTHSVFYGFGHLSVKGLEEMQLWELADCMAHLSSSTIRHYAHKSAMTCKVCDGERQGRIHKILSGGPFFW